MDHKMGGELARLSCSKWGNGSKSKWWLVMSGVPQGLTVGLVLFGIFKTIWMECTHTKVVDDTELEVR